MNVPDTLKEAIVDDLTDFIGDLIAYYGGEKRHACRLGEPQPMSATGERLYAALRDVVAAQGIEFVITDMTWECLRGFVPATDAEGVTDGRSIRLHSLLSGDDLPACTAHELAHCMLGHTRSRALAYDMDKCEAHAETVSYLVMKHFGIDTGFFSVPYVGNFIGGPAGITDRIIKQESALAILSCAINMILEVESRAAAPIRLAAA